MRIAVFCAAMATVLVPVCAGAQSPPLSEADALARLSPKARACGPFAPPSRSPGPTCLPRADMPNPRITFDREAVAGTTEYLTRVGQALPVTGYRGLQGAGGLR